MTRFTFYFSGVFAKVDGDLFYLTPEENEDFSKMVDAFAQRFTLYATLNNERREMYEKTWDYKWKLGQDVAKEYSKLKEKYDKEMSKLTKKIEEKEPGVFTIKNKNG